MTLGGVTQGIFPYVTLTSGHSYATKGIRLSSQLSFGVGCFNFGPIRPVPFRFRGADYLADLKAALSGIPNIDELKIYHSQFEEIEWTVEEKPSGIEEGEDYIPNIGGSTSRLRVEFTLHIPLRLQGELLEYQVESAVTAFRVIIDGSLFHGPVTFIVPSNEADSVKGPALDGSAAVVLVRRFLAREFPKASDRLRFECLGPSPFHVDLFVRPGNETVRGYNYRTERTPVRGYDIVTFLYDEAVYPSAETAADDIFHAIGDELSFYYYVERLDNSTASSWYDIESGLREVLTEEERSGLRHRVTRFFVTNSRVSNTFLRLAQFEAREAFRQRSLAQSYAEVFAPPNRAFFKVDVERLMSERFTAPVEPVRRMLDLLDSRSARRVDLVVVLIASVLGGTVGALLTRLVA